VSVETSARFTIQDGRVDRGDRVRPEAKMDTLKLEPVYRMLPIDGTG